jgi:hypothetical protein
MPTSINNDTVVVLGASTNTTRYSYKAVLWLRDAGFKVIAVGKNKGNIGDVEILQKLPENIQKLYAISIYLNPHNQREYYNWILSMNPSQIIFNPLAENEELEMLLNKKGINCIEACTLVMLRTGEF